MKEIIVTFRNLLNRDDLTQPQKDKVTGSVKKMYEESKITKEEYEYILKESNGE